MSGWPRTTTAFVLALVLAAGVSCTSDDALAPSDPAAPVHLSEDQQSLLLGEVVDGVKSMSLLSCSAQPYVAVAKVVGPGGGTMTPELPVTDSRTSAAIVDGPSSRITCSR